VFLPHRKIFTKFEADLLPSYSVLAPDTFYDFVTLTFDLGQWSYMAGHVVKPVTKFEDPTAIHS